MRAIAAMLRVLAILFVAVLAYWLLVFLAQRKIAFPAPPLAGAPPRPADAEQVWLEIPGARVEAWLLPPLGAGDAEAPVLLFAHGNGELIDYWPPEFDAPRRWGMAVLLVEYPGYGRSGGSPSERSVAATMEAAFDWSGTRADLDARRVVAYGRSLGGAALAGLTRTRQPAALVLESTFTSARDFARRVGAPGFLVRDAFDTLTAVERFRGPILVLHGDHDEIVPTEHGRRLAAAARVELRLLPCGHNDCPRPWRELETFLRAQHLIEGR